jgi:flagellar motor switch protein FliN
MDILEQSEVDALLASAESGGGRVDPGPQTAGASGGPGPPPSTRDLPEEFRLRAAPGTLKRLLAIRVPVTVRLAERQMPIEKVLGLTVGAIIEFDRHADSDLDLVVSNMPIGVGNAVKCGERFGLRVIAVQPLAQRLLAAGSIR